MATSKSSRAGVQEGGVDLVSLLKLPHAKGYTLSLGVMLLVVY